MPETSAALSAPAKINLFLEVVRRRADGYHDIDSVFQAVGLADRLAATRVGGEDITLSCEYPGIPLDSSNSIVKAASLLKRETGAPGGLRFRLEKAIPPEGGLGGGSSDAAAALRLADRLLGTNLPPARLAELAAAVGSDVPFFLYGGACLCRGRGEIITPVPPLPPERSLTLVLSNLRSGTAAAYGGLELPAEGSARRADEFVGVMRAGDDDALAGAAFNRFEKTVFAAIPDVRRLYRALAAVPGVRPRLSGSGASLWFPGAAEPLRAALAAGAELAELADEFAVRLVECRPRGVRDEIETATG